MRSFAKTLALCGIILLVLVFFVWRVSLEFLTKERFQRVLIGASDKGVRDIMGMPDFVNTGGSKSYCLIYSTLTTGIYVICFDTNGLVADKVVIPLIYQDTTDQHTPMPTQ